MVISNLWMFVSLKFPWNMAILVLPIGRVLFLVILGLKLRSNLDMLLYQCQTIAPVKRLTGKGGSKSTLQENISSSLLFLATDSFLLTFGAVWHPLQTQPFLNSKGLWWERFEDSQSTMKVVAARCLLCPCSSELVLSHPVLGVPCFWNPESKTTS